MPPTEAVEITVARIDQRVIAVERDVRDIKTSIAAQTPARPSWPSVLASIVATAALILTLIAR